MPAANHPPPTPESPPSAPLSADLRSQQPGLLLSQIGRVATRWITDALDPVDLKPRTGGALLLLRERGPLSQRELGAAMGIDASSLVGHLNELEEAGLIVRTRDPDDRRRHIVEITALGLQQRATADAAVLDVERRLLQHLDDDEVATLQRLLLKVHAVTGSLSPEDSGIGPVAR